MYHYDSNNVIIGSLPYNTGPNFSTSKIYSRFGQTRFIKGNLVYRLQGTSVVPIDTINNSHGICHGPNQLLDGGFFRFTVIYNYSPLRVVIYIGGIIKSDSTGKTDQPIKLLATSINTKSSSCYNLTSENVFFKKTDNYFANKAFTVTHGEYVNDSFFISFNVSYPWQVIDSNTFYVTLPSYVSSRLPTTVYYPVIRYGNKFIFPNQEVDFTGTASYPNICYNLGQIFDDTVWVKSPNPCEKYTWYKDLSFVGNTSYCKIDSSKKYSLIITDTCTGISKMEIFSSVPYKSEKIITTSTNICAGIQNITLQSSVSNKCANIDWFKNGQKYSSISSPPYSLSVNSPGQYYYLDTIEHCIVSDTVNISTATWSTINLKLTTGDSAFCPLNPIFYTTSFPTIQNNYTWYNNNFKLSASTSNINIQAVGNYYCISNDTSACITYISDTCKVTYLTPFVTKIIANGAQLTSNRPALYHNWYYNGQPYSNAAVITPIYPGKYDLQLSAGSECITQPASFYFDYGNPNRSRIEYQGKPSLYPNPSNGELTVILPSSPDETSRLDIYDLTGKKLYSQKLNDAFTYHNLNHLPAAVYTVTVRSHDHIEHVKWVKLN